MLAGPLIKVPSDHFKTIKQKRGDAKVFLVFLFFFLVITNSKIMEDAAGTEIV